jgi:hypothetical protein
MINLDLFLNGYITIRGCAFQRKGSVVCISAPGYNGKSSFLLQTLTEEGQYIAEDNLVVNLKWKEVYPTANAKMGKIYGRDANENLERTLDVESIVNTKRKIDEFYLVQNTTWPHQPYPKTMKDYIFMNSLYFLNNLFIRTYLCEERLSQTFHNMVEEYSKFSDYKFVQIKNYEYSQIFNGH